MGKYSQAGSPGSKGPMVFGRLLSRRDEFEREVRIEIEYLRRLHGSEAAKIAREKAARPRLRSTRRKVLEAAASRLDRPR